MHEICPVQEEFITYRNDGFRSGNAVVGWVDIGGSSRPITRMVVGRVVRGVATNDDGNEKIIVDTYVRSYKGDEPLSFLKGKISKVTEKYAETLLTDLFSRDYASTLAYSEFKADPAILFPGIERTIFQQEQHQPVLV